MQAELLVARVEQQMAPATSDSRLKNPLRAATSSIPLPGEGSNCPYAKLCNTRASAIVLLAEVQAI